MGGTPPPPTPTPFAFYWFSSILKGLFNQLINTILRQFSPLAQLHKGKGKHYLKSSDLYLLFCRKRFISWFHRYSICMFNFGAEHHPALLAYYAGCVLTHERMRWSQFVLHRIQNIRIPLLSVCSGIFVSVHCLAPSKAPELKSSRSNVTVTAMILQKNSRLARHWITKHVTNLVPFTWQTLSTVALFYFSRLFSGKMRETKRKQSKKRHIWTPEKLRLRKAALDTPKTSPPNKMASANQFGLSTCAGAHNPSGSTCWLYHELSVAEASTEMNGTYLTSLFPDGKHDMLDN